MKKIILLSLYSIAGIYISAQKADSLFAHHFFWADSVEGDWGYGPHTTSINHSVTFYKDYKIENIYDFTQHWKTYADPYLYKSTGDSFISIKPGQMFHDPDHTLLNILADSVRATFSYYHSLDSECFYGYRLPDNILLDDFSIEATREKLVFTYYFEVPPPCDVYGISYTGFTWLEIEPFLQLSTNGTPRYCTPSGPKVNVRKEPSAKAHVKFQLDRGEFFKILSTEKEDKVNGKPGSWLKIKYGSQEGYIFSFYTLCR